MRPAATLEQERADHSHGLTVAQSQLENLLDTVRTAFASTILVALLWQLEEIQTCRLVYSCKLWCCEIVVSVTACLCLVRRMAHFLAVVR